MDQNSKDLHMKCFGGAKSFTCLLENGCANVYSHADHFPEISFKQKVFLLKKKFLENDQHGYKAFAHPFSSRQVNDFPTLWHPRNTSYGDLLSFGPNIRLLCDAVFYFRLMSGTALAQTKEIEKYSNNNGFFLSYAYAELL